MKKFRKVQIRLKEGLGDDQCFYAFRWVLNLGFISFRVHHFLRSEPIAHKHDHAWDYITFILKGGYLDVSPNKIDKLKTGSIRFRKAEHIHTVVIPKSSDCWTFLIAFKPRRKWGFWVNGKLKRPLKYFARFKHLPCSDE